MAETNTDNSNNKIATIQKESQGQDEYNFNKSQDENGIQEVVGYEKVVS